MVSFMRFCKGLALTFKVFAQLTELFGKVFKLNLGSKEDILRLRQWKHTVFSPSILRRGKD